MRRSLRAGVRASFVPGSLAYAKSLSRFASPYHPACYTVTTSQSLHSYQFYSSSVNSSHNEDKQGVPVLRGQCSCGKTGWECTGPSVMNFVCHCSVCRGAAKVQNLPATAFKENQVKWINEKRIKTVTPHKSNNKRFYCRDCETYLGEDATRSLGVFAFPLATVEGGQATVPLAYQPNHHIFYENRVADVADNLPKWKTLIQGDLIPTPTSSTSEKSPKANLKTGSGETYNTETGNYHKDVLPLSPTRAPDPTEYMFPETDPPPNHITEIPEDMLQKRIRRKYNPSPNPTQILSSPNFNRVWDAIIIGGGHNGLTAASYLAKYGRLANVLVLERRDKVGGAAVTEEIIPGFKFSRASYLAGLLRPKVISELNIQQHGFKYLPRDPSSFTPSTLDGPLQGKYLMLGSDEIKNHASISQFSTRDADAMPKYEAFLDKCRTIIEPFLDGPPPNPLGSIPFTEKVADVKRLYQLVRVGMANSEAIAPFYELFTGPASQILDRWFESEIVKTTLATDAVIGALCSPTQLGSAYVLLHHVMGEAAGRKGVWAYVEGGMGAISNSIAKVAEGHGATIVTNATVDKILYKYAPDLGISGRTGVVTGVQMQDGTVLKAKNVLSNCTPYHTFLELLPGLSHEPQRAGWDANTELENELPLSRDFQKQIRFTDYSCGAFKINCAIDRLPNFSCFPNEDPAGIIPGPQHFGTIHFETTMQEIENACREASMGMPATRPVIEMTIPSSLDRTIAPEGKHVCQLFVQFAPYNVDPKVGNWADEDFKNRFADRVFKIIDELAPGFSSSVIGRDVLSPLDLEQIFGLHKGNIFHGAMSLHQLAYNRPAFGWSNYRTPLAGLYMCGSGAHPGGGVMAAVGRNAANAVMSDMGINVNYDSARDYEKPA